MFSIGQINWVTCQFGVLKSASDYDPGTLAQDLSRKGIQKLTASSSVTQNTFINDCKKMWNLANEDIKNSKSLFTAKKTIKKFVNNLPVFVFCIACFLILV